MLWRAKAATITQTYTSLQDLTLDIAAKQVTRGGKVIDLTAKEYALLEFMMRNRAWSSLEQIENNLLELQIRGWLERRQRIHRLPA